MTAGIKNSTDPTPIEPHIRPTVKISLIAVSSILAIIGIISNISIIAAMFRHKKVTLRNNITNIFVLTLAISDVILCSLCMPLQFWYGLRILSPTTLLCKLAFFSFGIPVYISCLTIFFIALDRYQMIVNMWNRRMTVRQALLLIMGAIVFSLGNSVPVLVYSRLGEAKPVNCSEFWPASWIRLAYSILIFSLHFLIPLIASGSLYVAIYRSLQNRAINVQASKEVRRKKKKTTRLLLAVVICYTVCWTPWCIYTILVETSLYFVPSHSCGSDQKCKFLPSFLKLLKKMLKEGELATYLSENCLAALSKLDSSSLTLSKSLSVDYSTLIDLLVKLFAMSSACVNPFLYGWLNKPIRDDLIALYKRVTCVEKFGKICYKAANVETPVSSQIKHQSMRTAQIGHNSTHLCTDH
ncbi:hypothetical protein Ciccas_009112 [Cichlidogyrus casuarinus]|uniref:G-protein coupled receptors family 1 profile domain-containing protein n=1 Tax=Cichlidogyrus casuarinus TaxID=1844966 RepID=A0ABD2PZN1_9PLAT